MTRLTNQMRDQIQRKITSNLPVRNYAKEIHKIVQDAVVKHMPASVRAVYDDEKSRKFLCVNQMSVSIGNSQVSLWADNCDRVIGAGGLVQIRMDEQIETMLVVGTLQHTVYHTLKSLDLVTGYFAQLELHRDVERRLKANLSAATTIKSLYEVLEPDLHGYIPQDISTSKLPSTVAPVADDLRKLGAVLPKTPKATDK